MGSSILFWGDFPSDNRCGDDGHDVTDSVVPDVTAVRQPDEEIVDRRRHGHDSISITEMDHES